MQLPTLAPLLLLLSLPTTVLSQSGPGPILITKPIITFPPSPFASDYLSNLNLTQLSLRSSNPRHLTKHYPTCAQPCANDFFDTYMAHCGAWVNTTKHVRAAWSCVCAHSVGFRLGDGTPYERGLGQCARRACGEEEYDDEVGGEMGEVEGMERRWEEYCGRVGKLANITISEISLLGKPAYMSAAGTVGTGGMAAVVGGLVMGVVAML